MITPEITKILDELQSLKGLVASGVMGRPVLQNAVLPIFTDTPNDMVHFDMFGGTIPVAIIGKKTSDDEFQNIVTAGGNDFTLVAANSIDSLLIEHEGINIPELAQYFKIQTPLTGVGTTIAFTSGIYSEVLYFYLNSGTPAASGVVGFETIEGLSVYANSAITSNRRYVVCYGKAILDKTQFTISQGGIELLLDEAVEANRQLVLLPVEYSNVVDATAGQTVLSYFPSEPIAFIVYQQQVITSAYYASNDGLKLGFEAEAGKEIFIVPRRNMVSIATVQGQDAYTHSLLNGVLHAVVLYGQMPLEPSEYLIEGSEIVLDIDGEVQEGLKLFVIPKNYV